MLRPQSNQRGIETPVDLLESGRPPGPQSNQRGIETGDECADGLRAGGASIEPAWD